MPYALEVEYAKIGLLVQFIWHLAVQLLGEEVGHVAVGFFGLGEADVIPEGVGKGFEDDEAGVVSTAEEGAMQDAGPAEENVATAGDEQGWGHAVEVGVEGRENGVFGVGGASVLGAARLGAGYRDAAGEAAEGVEGEGVAVLAEVAHAGEDAEGGGEGQVELFETDGYFGGEDGSGRGSVEGDVGGLVGLEEVAVDGDGVVDGGGKGVLGCEAVEDSNDTGVSEVGDGDGLGEGAGVGVEAAAVYVDEDVVGVCVLKGEDVADRDVGDGEGFDLDGVGFSGCFAGAGLPGVGAGAALGQGSVFGSGGAA